MVSHVFEVAKDYVVCKNLGVMAVVSFFSHRFGKRKSCLTQRAPDWWESARFQAVFVAGSWFRQGSVVLSRPPAGNASRWAVKSRKTKQSNNMDEITSKIYIRFLDGVDVYIPVDTRRTSDGTYLLMPDDEFDYEDDAVLFEFGNQDVVKAKEIQFENGDVGQVAYKLIKAGDRRNLQKRLLFHLALQTPEPQAIFEGVDRNEIRSLYQKIEQAPFVYPTVKDWFVTNKDKIESMM